MPTRNLSRWLPPTLAAFFFLSPAFASQPDPDGCYRANWFYPWLDLPSVNCTHPALGDPDIGPVHFIGEAHPKPPKECPYEGPRNPGGDHPEGNQETNDIGEHAWHDLGN